MKHLIAKVLLMGFMAVACNSASDKDFFTDRARQFFDAAIKGDSGRLFRISVDSLPVQTALAASRAEPRMMRLAAESLAFEAMSQDANTANVFFRTPRSERISVGFVRRDSVWLINHVGFLDHR